MSMTDFSLKTLVNDIARNIGKDASARFAGIKKQLEDAALQGDDAINEVLNSLDQATRDELLEQVQDGLSPQTKRVINTAKAALFAGNLGEFMASKEGQELLGDGLKAGAKMLNGFIKGLSEEKKQTTPTDNDKGPGYVSFKRNNDGGVVSPFFFKAQAAKTAAGTATNEVENVVAANQFHLTKEMNYNLALSDMTPQEQLEHFRAMRGISTDTSGSAVSTPINNDAAASLYGNPNQTSQTKAGNEFRDEILDSVTNSFGDVDEINEVYREKMLSQHGGPTQTQKQTNTKQDNGEILAAPLENPTVEHRNSEIIASEELNPYWAHRASLQLSEEIKNKKSSMPADVFLDYQKSVYPRLAKYSEDMKDSNKAMSARTAILDQIRVAENSYSKDVVDRVKETLLPQLEYLEMIIDKFQDKNQQAKQSVEAIKLNDKEKQNAFEKNLEAAKNMDPKELKQKIAEQDAKMRAEAHKLGINDMPTAQESPTSPEDLKTQMAKKAKNTLKTLSQSIDVPDFNSSSPLLKAFIQGRAKYEVAMKDLALKRWEMSDEAYFAYSQVMNMELQRLKAINEQMLGLEMEDLKHNIGLLKMTTPRG